MTEPKGEGAIEEDARTLVVAACVCQNPPEVYAGDGECGACVTFRALVADAASLRTAKETSDKERYLGLDCPLCGRRRLLYQPTTGLIHCEKCESDTDTLNYHQGQARTAKEELERELESVRTGWQLQTADWASGMLRVQGERDAALAAKETAERERDDADVLCDVMKHDLLATRTAKEELERRVKDLEEDDLWGQKYRAALAAKETAEAEVKRLRQELIETQHLGMDWSERAETAERERDEAKEVTQLAAQRAYDDSVRLMDSEAERGRLEEALRQVRQEADKDWFHAPDSLCGVIQAITDQVLSNQPSNQEDRG